ncbi:MAG: hypothetical protein IT200_18055 [Thermoleophilia bacterium]|nr:hypothetical protein [Thermoleophilia bacterium]
MAKRITTKKKCCKSSPRCKNCPVVWKRLEAAGLAERMSKRTWRRTRGKIPKAVMKLMRR